MPIFTRRNGQCLLSRRKGKASCKIHSVFCKQHSLTSCHVAVQLLYLQSHSCWIAVILRSQLFWKLLYCSTSSFKGLSSASIDPNFVSVTTCRVRLLHFSKNKNIEKYFKWTKWQTHSELNELKASWNLGYDYVKTHFKRPRFDATVVKYKITGIVLAPQKNSLSPNWPNIGQRPWYMFLLQFIHMKVMTKK